LEKLLPDLIQPEFTAQMETALDAIATGEQEWQAYLIGWNREYFAPAIAKAKSQLLSLPTFTEHQPASTAIGSERSPTPKTKPAKGQVTKTKCPTCGEVMTKVPSRSKKMKAKHFLKCSGASCGTVMFWNAKAKRYELPHAQRQALNPEMFVDHPCPVCGAMLERYAYTKDGSGQSHVALLDSGESARQVQRGRLLPESRGVLVTQVWDTETARASGLVTDKGS
jgi:DNA topoisomerase-1